LAVVAERPDLIAKNLITKQMNSNGFYTVRLFIDGKWKYITVDDHFALRPPNYKRKGRESKKEDGDPLHFCKSSKKQLWAPIIEKSYAKAHGSYKAISGGKYCF
jgi:calpain-15